MHSFFSQQINKEEILLDPIESMHAIRVLRLSSGDEVKISDGKGNLYTGVIQEANPRQVIIRISGHQQHTERASYSLHLAIAPTKNMNRFEFFLEKAIETGIDEITPIQCEHSERNNIRIDRLQKVAIAALKQSGQLFLPRINPMIPFSSLIIQPFIGDKFIAHCCTHEKAQDYLPEAIISNHILLLIGPEGDFSRKELDQAFRNHYHPVSLGPSRLRTETAGVTAAILTASRFLHDKTKEQFL